MNMVIAFILGVIAGIILTIVFILFLMGAAHYDEVSKPPTKDDWRELN